MGEDRESGATQYTFLGVQFDHAHRAVSLRKKFVRSVRAMPALSSLTIVGVEVTASRFLCAAVILRTRLCDCYFFSKAVRRRLSVHNRGIVLETSPASLPPAAVGLGEGFRRMIENNRKRNIKPTGKASAATITDASLHGWGAVFIPDSGHVKIAGGKWERKPFLIMQHKARGALGLIGSSSILPSTIDVLVDNTSLQGAVNKESSKSHAMTWKPQRIYEFLDARGIQAIFACGLQTAYHSIVFLHLRTWRRGGKCEGQRRGQCGWRSSN
ncbi:lanosterol 14-alpha-demethylase, putative, partial [Trypanosoma cruzi marinkellei]